jgi:hypothetical protein
MQIDWTVLTYAIIGLFALTGFFRGWWKEAISTILLVVLLFFLQQPTIAESFVAVINNIISMVWQILPNSITQFLADTLGLGVGASAVGGVPQLDPTSGTTWLLILILFMVTAILISRPFLRNYGPTGYSVRPLGSILGGLVGGLNGLIIISLVREYLDGRNLPQTATTVVAPGAQVGVTSTGAIGVVNVPSITIMDSYIPWAIMLIGIVVFLAAVKNRVAWRYQDGFSKVGLKEPLGHKKY